MRRRSLATMIVLMTVLAPQARCQAQGFVAHFEPPVLERGKTTRVVMVGSQLGKAVGLWTSLADDAVKATPVGAQSATRAVLDVQVAATAPVGICGVRLATEDGLANACLMMIDDLPVRNETVDTKVKLPVSVWGRFREATVDRYTIEVGARQRVSFEAVGNRLGKDVDPLVTLRDAKGKIVAEHDNDPGLYFDCRFEHVFATAGAYTVEIRDARFHGSEHGMYVLRMGKFPAERNVLPMAVKPGIRAELMRPRGNIEVPNDAAGLFFGTLKLPGDDGSAWVPLEAMDAEVTVHNTPANSFEETPLAKTPGALCGILQKPGDRHYFKLDLAKGQRIQIRADARAFNSPADLEIGITDAKGKEIRRAGENTQEEIVLDFNAGAPGIHGVSVRDIHRDGGPAFAYRLDVRTPQPAVQVIAEVEGLTVPCGTYQPIPLTLSRRDHAGKVGLKLIGAPPGLTLTPNEIDAGVNAVVCKLAAAASAPLGLGTFQILATPLDAKDALPTLVRTRPLVDRQIVNVDLIPYGLREDQRRLPPSLGDRFALQVTSASFFTFELPESQVTLGRYQHVEYPIAVTHGSKEPKITFSARGGQIAPKEEGRTRVYAEFARGKGSIHSKILTNLTKHRVEVTAVGVLDDRRVSLTRTFELDVRSAFTVSAEPALLKIEPGMEGKVRLKADRLATFESGVTVQITPTPGLELPSTIVIARGQSSVDIPIKIDATRPPGRININLNATAEVNGFEEEQRGRIEIDVIKTPTPKK